MTEGRMDAEGTVERWTAEGGGERRAGARTVSFSPSSSASLSNAALLAPDVAGSAAAESALALWVDEARLPEDRDPPWRLDVA